MSRKDFQNPAIFMYFWKLSRFLKKNFWQHYTRQKTHEIKAKTKKIKQIMITSLQHYKKKELYQGVVIENYEIQLFNHKICGEDKAFNTRTCISI